MKKFGALRVFLLIVLVLVLSVIPTLATYFSHDDITKEQLFGEESELQGVLVVWNIDTFEGGTMGKSTVLEKTARYFENKHKGLMILVENLTVEEFVHRSTGDLPDVISFGSGIWDKVQSLVVPTASDAQIYQNVLGAAGNAAPWALGAYFMLSTQEALERAGKEGVDLLEQRFGLGYTKTIGKQTRETKSLTFGKTAYHSPLPSLERLGEVEMNAVDELAMSQTPYEAYVRFGSNHSVALLGAQRDLARLENKLSQGAVSELVVEPLGQTDMVQYAAVVGGKDAIRTKYAELYCAFLQSEKVQQAVLGAGMLPVRQAPTEESGTLSDWVRSGGILRLEIKKLF